MVGRSGNYLCKCNACSRALEVDSPWRQVDPPRAVQWDFDISYELRTGVAAGVGIYLAGRILLLVCELRFCIWMQFNSISLFQNITSI